MIPDTLLAALVDLLRHNRVLEQLTLNIKFRSRPDNCSWPDPTIDFYLKLNRAGRNKLLGGATRIDWINAINANSDDVSMSFYLLSNQPQLCAVAPPRSASRPTTKDGRVAVASISTQSVTGEDAIPTKRQRIVLLGHTAHGDR